MSKKAIIVLDEGSMTSGTVENLIEITDSGAIGFKLPDGRLMWDCGNYPVAIGDNWKDGVFSRDGAALVPIPTAEEEIAEIRAQLDALLLGGDSE